MNPYNFAARAFDEPPTQAMITMGTSAYNGEAKAGIYMPLKLGHLKGFNSANAFVQQQCPGLTIPVIPGASAAIPSGNTGYPYFLDGSNTLSWPSLRVKDSNAGIIFFDGLTTGVGSTLRIRLRYTIEMRPAPGTTYSSMVEVPPAPDELAFRMITEVQARMADAYPASYNDSGKLLDFIQSISKRILPYVEPALSVLSTMPGTAGLIGSVAQKAMPTIKALAARPRVSQPGTPAKASPKKGGN